MKRADEKTFDYFHQHCAHFLIGKPRFCLGERSFCPPRGCNSHMMVCKAKALCPTPHQRSVLSLIPTALGDSYSLSLNSNRNKQNLVALEFKRD